MAEAEMGNGNRAYDYYRSFLPSAFNDKAEIRETEPYVYAQTTNSKHNMRFGASRNPWLSGTTSWAYFAAAQAILGIKPGYKGLIIDPCIPSKWDGFKATRKYRGKMVNIEVKNPNKVCKGVTSVIVNGNAIEGNEIPFEILKDTNSVVVTMG
jgi:N,N'-diacetylchitobiose phosphorylase